jgi:hypothetical protein
MCIHFQFHDSLTEETIPHDSAISLKNIPSQGDEEQQLSLSFELLFSSLSLLYGYSREKLVRRLFPHFQSCLTFKQNQEEKQETKK